MLILFLRILIETGESPDHVGANEVCCDKLCCWCDHSCETAHYKAQKLGQYRELGGQDNGGAVVSSTLGDGWGAFVLISV